MGFDAGTNLISYSEGDPVNFLDANGLEITSTFRETPTQIPGSRTKKTDPGKTKFNYRDSPPGPCRLRADGTWGFDASVSAKAHEEFISKKSMSGPSEESGPGLTLKQHEDLHMGDYRTACQQDVINQAIDTEGFTSPDECEAARGDFRQNLKDYFSNVERELKQSRDDEGDVQ